MFLRCRWPLLRTQDTFPFISHPKERSQTSSNFTCLTALCFHSGEHARLFLRNGFRLQELYKSCRLQAHTVHMTAKILAAMWDCQLRLPSRVPETIIHVLSFLKPESCWRGAGIVVTWLDVMLVKAPAL